MFQLSLKHKMGSRIVSGINIGSHSIKIVSLSKTSSGFSLDRFLVEQIAEGFGKEGKRKNALNEALTRAINKAGIGNTDVVTGVSGPAVVVRYIDVPQMSKGDLKSAVKFEAKSHLPFDLKDVILDFQILDQGKPEEGRKMKILLVAAQRNFIYQHIELLEKQGLRPLVIDVDSFALVNAFLRANQEEAQKSEAIALVNLGARLTNVSILNKGVLLFTRDIPMGGNNLTESIAKRVNLDLTRAERLKQEIEEPSSSSFEIIVPVLENLVNEIRRSFDYYESQTTAAERVSFKVFLSGGAAKLKGIDSFLNRVLDVPVSLWDPLRNINIPRGRIDRDKLDANLPYLCVGVGLAFRGQEIK